MTAFYILLLGYNFQLVVRPFFDHLSTEFMKAQNLKSRIAAKEYQYYTTSKFRDLIKQQIFLYTNKTV